MINLPNVGLKNFDSGPGAKWLESFFKRHPGVAQNKANRIDNSDTNSTRQDQVSTQHYALDHFFNLWGKYMWNKLTTTLN